MQIDMGTAVIILAVLIFYLRLIIIQRERARRLRQVRNPGKKTRDKQQSILTNYSILNQDLHGRVIAGSGILAILAGVLLNLKVIQWNPVQTYWWVPVAAGIVAFSWGFK